jgi:nucleoside-diphosphate-sugar epimerase
MEAEAILTAPWPGGPSVAIVRPQSFLGPGRLGAFGIIFGLIMAGEPVPILGKGRNRYQLLGVQDLAHGITLLAASEARGVFAFGARPFSTVREDLQALVSHARSASTLRSVPMALARAGLRALELAGFDPLSEWHRHSAWSRDSIADTTRAEQELRWVPARSNVEALVEAYDWYVVTVRATGDAPRTHPLPHAHRLLKRFLWMLPKS